MSSNVSKKRKFVADGVFFAELNELLTRELARGYRASQRGFVHAGYHPRDAHAERARREGAGIRELTSVVQKRWNLPRTRSSSTRRLPTAASRPSRSASRCGTS